MRVLLVGDKPSPLMKPGAKPFEGAKCEKLLNKWIKYLDANGPWVVTDLDFRVVNSIDEDFISAVLEAVLLEDPIIALGNNASEALGMAKHFKLPHPSGRNRQLNDPSFIKRRLKACVEYLEFCLVCRR